MHSGSRARDLDVVALGETMVLVVPVDAEPLRTATEVRLDIGGAESTVALYLAESGHRTAWASRVGDDPLGARILDTLTRYGVDTTWVQMDPDAPTGVYFKDPGSRVRYYRSGSAASRMTPGWLAELDLRRTAMLHLTGITPALSASCAATVDRAVESARSAGAAVCVDVNFRPALWSRAVAAPVLLALARRADVVLVGRDEAESLWDSQTAGEIAGLIGPGPTVVVKDGAVGATELSAAGTTFVPTPPVLVVEEVGAGDAFAAGYLGAWLDGADPSARLAAGHRTAARALSSVSDFVPMRG